MLLLPSPVKLVGTYISAFGRKYTYDGRRNAYLWFGVLWGLPIPIFSIALDFALTGVGGRTPLDAISQHPLHLFFLAHPVLFALVFGAMGTLRHDLERENERLIGSLLELATTDPLTGLYNRRYMFEELEKAISRSNRSGQCFSVILFDLDGFKAVNDEEGHPAGDTVLRKVADALRSVLRQGDVLARYGGDEFLLQMHSASPSAAHLVDRATVAVQRHAGMEISAGVAGYPDDGGTPEELISAADERLGMVKRTHHERAQSPARR